jgi:hypothetical protein
MALLDMFRSVLCFWRGPRRGGSVERLLGTIASAQTDRSADRKRLGWQPLKVVSIQPGAGRDGAATL